MFFAISASLKIIKNTFKIPSNPSKINLSSNSLKIFKKSIQIIQNKTPTPTQFHPQKSSISRNSIIKKSLSHRTHQNSHHKSKHLTLISYSKIIQQEKSTLQLHTYLEESESDNRRLLLRKSFRHMFYTCFTLDAIEHNKEIRTLYETMVDNLLAKYNLTENLSDTKYKTIFDNQ